MWRQGGNRVRIQRNNVSAGGRKESVDRLHYSTSETTASIAKEETVDDNPQPSLMGVNSFDTDSDPFEDDSDDETIAVSGVHERESVSIRSRSFHMETISLRYNLLKEEHVKTLCVTLMYNKSVKNLDLRGCHLSTQSCQYVSEMMSHNHTITLLDLSENALRTPGLILLRDYLLFNMALASLHLDSNELIDSDAMYIYTILKTSRTLQKLSIEGNQFCTAAGEVFHKMLKENNSLTSLNISWNQLRMNATILFIQGLAMNSKLVDLNISWNGLGLQGAVAMASCLKLNTTLKVLDLSSNRITREAFRCFVEGLLANQTLQVLKIGDNPITTDGVMDLMALLCKSRTRENMKGCKEIDFADICVGNDFAALYADVRKHRDIIIKHGSAVRQTDVMQVHLATVIHSEQPSFILFDCMRKSNLRIVDLFHAFDKDKSGTLSRQELKEGLLSMSIPLSSRALDLLIKHNDTDNDGEVSLTDLLAVQKDYQKYVAKKRSQEQKRPESAAHRRAKTLVNLRL